MASSIDTVEFEADAFNRGTDPVLRIFSHEQVAQLASYRADDTLRQEIDQLASKSAAGTLTAAEAAKYEGYVRANKFLAILQAQARKFLASQKHE
jgi:hypothetical protein